MRRLRRSAWKLLSFITLILLLNQTAYAQSEDSTKEVLLPSVIIKAFGENKELKNVPGAISYISKATLSAFGPLNLVSSLNTAPGVRMEERSPGSYRLNIRGSSLRSPFGVRNVKIYYNDIPLTDPGGNTYFNQLGIYNMNSIEISKGANNSIYGAGTGGAMLIESLNPSEKTNTQLTAAAGSYQMQNIYGSLTTNENHLLSKFGVQHQESDGYRDHSQMRRNVFNWNGLFNLSNNRILKTTFLYGNLFYQTPGALTKKEFDFNPRDARPSVGNVPGAVMANAFIQQQMFLAGMTYVQPIVSNLVNSTTLYGNFSELRNPSIASYGKSSEPNFGGRTVFKFQKAIGGGQFKTDAGFEYQRGFTSVAINKNVGGAADSLRTYDEINNFQDFVFAQLSYDINAWTFTAGASINKSGIKFQRFVPSSLGIKERTFKNQVAPRFAVMRKLGNVNIYSSISRGFSPPTTAELLPTGGAINLGLNAEKAVNYEVGIKATLFRNLYVDVNAFVFSLDNTIVQTRNASATDFYYNAGGTKQRGVESFLTYQLFTHSAFIKSSNLALSYTLYDFHYKNFIQQNIDYSGKQLPSVAPNTFNGSFNVTLMNGFFGNINYFYSDKIALNDGNTEFGSSYGLLSGKIGVKKFYKNAEISFSAGADNLFDVRYSLGNDINGFAGRYYNAAPGRNYYVSIALGLYKKDHKGS